MKITEIRALDDGDLQVQLEKLRRELFDLRVRAATESIDNPRAIREIRRTVARIITEQHQRSTQGSAS
ncbi:MAG: 50S ribosomal protein L29 [Planctomycetes bacterium]|nr:50S ribosomal protein L29 [Planctomycetota bacterium]